ncbi:MAG: hypothetical protein Q4D81_05425, partial [Eubacteriales bacterium]|nr:hypothetical protein [Eubacteriales bacterium]
MSFSGGVREEIAQIIPSGRQAMETSAAALLANIGTVYREDDGTLWLRLSAGNPIAFRKCFTLILKNVNIRPDLFGRRFSSEWAGWRWKGNSRGKALSSLLLPVGHKAVRAISREDTAPDSGKDSGKKEAVQTGEEASGDRTASAEPGGKLSDGCPVPAEAGERPSGSSRPLPGGPVEGTTGNRKMSAEADAKTAGAGLQNVEQLAEPLE